MTYSYYPGCTLSTKGKVLDVCGRAAMAALGVELKAQRLRGLAAADVESLALRAQRTAGIVAVSHINIPPLTPG